MSKILISIIMASYNSENIIGRSLESIRNQSMEQTQIEILVVDGGSTDDTVQIAERYGATIINNNRRLPEPAKRLGMRIARGTYIQIMDSDEVLRDEYVLARRVDFMNNHPEIHCLIGGHMAPEAFSPCGHYISNVGDPFSCFIYRWYYGGNIGLIKKHDVLNCKDGYIGRFSNDDMIPIGDSVTLFRREYLYDNYEHLIDDENTSTLFSLIVRATGLVGHVTDDFVLHYTKSDIKTYFRKLRFRVINNIFDVNGSGYASVSQGYTKMAYRKYLYVIYCLSIILPLVDGIRMSIYYRQSIFMMHPIFAWYVLGQIGIQYTKKILGINVVNKQYG